MASKTEICENPAEFIQRKKSKNTHSRKRKKKSRKNPRNLDLRSRIFRISNLTVLNLGQILIKNFVSRFFNLVSGLSNLVQEF